MSNLLKKAWNQAKSEAAPKTFPEGKDIPCRIVALKMKSQEGNKENIDISLQFKTLDKGITHFQNYQCYDRTFGEYEFKGQEDVNRLMLALKASGFEMEADTSIEEVQETLREEEVNVLVTSKANKKGYITVYVNRPMPGVAAAPKVEAEEDLDELDSDDEDLEEDFDEELELEVGMIVTAKPPRHRTVKEYKIVMLNEETETASLKEMKSGDVVDSVPLDKILKAVDA